MLEVSTRLVPFRVLSAFTNKQMFILAYPEEKIQTRNRVILSVLVSQSQKQSNDIRASVDMEECIDIEKMNCSSEFCNDEPSTDSLLDSVNVTSTVVDHENESDAQETSGSGN